MKRKILLLFLLALSIRLILIYQLKTNKSFFFESLTLDPLYYDKWAREILHGDWFGKNRIFDLSPFYAYFLAILYKISGNSVTNNLLFVRVIQSILDSFSCIFVYLIGRKIYSEKIGIIASIITIFYAPLIYYTALIKKISLGIFLTLSSVVILLYSIKSTSENDSLPTTISFSNRLIFISGILFGLSVLTIGNNLVLVPLILIWIFAKSCKSESESRKLKYIFYRLIFVICFLLGMISTIAPVTIRNRIVNDDWILIDTSVFNIYIGTISKSGLFTSTEFNSPVPGKLHEDFRKEAKLRTGNPNLKPSQASSFWVKESVKYIIANPITYLKSIARKFALFWNVYEVPCNENFYFFKRFASILRFPLFHFGIIAPFGIIGMIIAWKTTPFPFSIFNKNDNGINILYSFILIYMLGILPFYIYSRFRINIVPFLSVFSAFGVIWIIEHIKCLILDIRIKKQVSSVKYLKILFVLLLLIMLFIGINRTIVSYNDGLKYAYYGYGIVCFNNKQYLKAIECFNFGKEYRISPSDYNDSLRVKIIAHSSLGRMYIEEGQWEMAITPLLICVKYDSTYIPALNNLGIAYRNIREYDKAIFYLEKAIDLKSKQPSPVRAKIQNSLSELASLYEEIGEYNKALKVWQRILDYEPNDKVEEAKKHIAKLSKSTF